MYNKQIKRLLSDNWAKVLIKRIIMLNLHVFMILSMFWFDRSSVCFAQAQRRNPKKTLSLTTTAIITTTATFICIKETYIASSIKHTARMATVF